MPHSTFSLSPVLNQKIDFLQRGSAQIKGKIDMLLQRIFGKGKGAILFKKEERSLKGGLARREGDKKSLGKRAKGGTEGKKEKTYSLFGFFSGEKEDKKKQSHLF